MKNQVFQLFRKSADFAFSAFTKNNEGTSSSNCHWRLLCGQKEKQIPQASFPLIDRVRQ